MPKATCQKVKAIKNRNIEETAKSQMKIKNKRNI